MQAIARWLGGAKQAPLLLVALVAAVLAAVTALGVAASAASAATTFSNNDDITFNDGGACSASSASRYPSEISVSGLGSSLWDVNVTISGLSHSVPDDIGLLLVSPAGQSTILITDSGGLFGVSYINLTFDDAVSKGAPDDDDPLTSGTYRPSQGGTTWGCYAPESFPAPAPAGPYTSPPQPPQLSDFNGSDPNGTWKLYVIDDSEGDAGSISGWSLDISTAPPDTTAPSVSCSASQSKLRLPANNHKLVTITTTVSVTDSGGSGPDGFKLLSVTSNQADSGLGPDDVPNDIQGWTTGTADTSGQLRAERYRADRIYTLTYQGKDKAGNTKNCTTTVRVPKG